MPPLPVVVFGTRRLVDCATPNRRRWEAEERPLEPLCLPSVTADPNEANWSRLPTRTYAVVPITPMVPVPTVVVISVVIPDVVMTVMVVIAPMILVMIVAFRVALIVPIVITAFSSEGRYGK